MNILTLIAIILTWFSIGAFVLHLMLDYDRKNSQLQLDSFPLSQILIFLIFIVLWPATLIFIWKDVVAPIFSKIRIRIPNPYK